MSEAAAAPDVDVAAGLAARTIVCVGCRGVVPDVHGPIHRYMTAAPGCWRAYTELMAGGLPPSPELGLAVDAFAVTHPGVQGPQSTPSVWIHLMTLCLVLERRWPVTRAIDLRRLAADRFAAWPWLERPAEMGDVTAIDLHRAVAAGDGVLAMDLTHRWIHGAWTAWSAHHPAVRERADWLAKLLG